MEKTSLTYRLKWSKGCDMKLDPTQKTENPAGQATFTTKVDESSGEYQKFETLAKAIVKVPKSEIDEKRKEARRTSSQ